MADYEDDDYEIPLQDQRIFGAGIKRKRVKFVPSSSSVSNTLPTHAQSSKSTSDLYLSIVLPKKSLEESTGKETGKETPRVTDATNGAVIPQTHTCEICNLPLDAVEDEVVATNNNDSEATTSKKRPHEASLAHQVCLTHSHPPSHLDRNRKGLAFLSSYGWDPDARKGLGASGQGIQFPIKTKEKNDKLGIGVVVPQDKDLEKMRKVKDVKLDAGKVRKLAERDRKRTEKLREAFYRSEDVERYLGVG